MSVYRILGGVHLSSLEPLLAEQDLHTDHNITHIISVIGGPNPVPLKYTEPPYTHLQIPIDDTPHTNIIEHFATCNEFIESAKPGNVLVHCAQGVSRSVTIIVAYLMQKHQLKVAQAMHAVRRKKDDVEPNHSFIRQLKVYEAMGYKVDVNRGIYVDLLNDLNERIDADSLREKVLLNKASEETTVDLERPFRLRCKKCREHISRSAELAFHIPPSNDSRQAHFIKTAPNSRRIIKAEGAARTCLHYFYTEPLAWMTNELKKGEIEGKFACPKCTAKIGGYSWKGSRCSCGKWMVPAIHVQSAKVDRFYDQVEGNQMEGRSLQTGGEGAL